MGEPKCPKNIVTFFPFYKTFINWITVPYECRQNQNPDIPIYVTKKHHFNVFTWLDGNKNKPLILILLGVACTLFFMVSCLYMTKFLSNGYTEGGVQKLNKRLKHLVTFTTVKALLTPVMPI